MERSPRPVEQLKHVVSRKLGAERGFERLERMAQGGAMALPSGRKRHRSGRGSRARRSERQKDGHTEFA